MRELNLHYINPQISPWTLIKLIDSNTTDMPDKVIKILEQCDKTERKKLVNFIDSHGNTGLHYLFSGTQVIPENLVKYIVDSGFDFRIKDRNGDTVFHKYLKLPKGLCRYRIECQQGALECIYMKNNKGETPIFDLIYLLFEKYSHIKHKIMELFESDRLTGLDELEYISDKAYESLCRKYINICGEWRGIDIEDQENSRIIITEYSYNIRNLNNTIYDILLNERKRVETPMKNYFQNNTSLCDDVIDLIFNY